MLLLALVVCLTKDFAVYSFLLLFLFIPTFFGLVTSAEVSLARYRINSDFRINLQFVIRMYGLLRCFGYQITQEWNEDLLAVAHFSRRQVCLALFVISFVILPTD